MRVIILAEAFDPRVDAARYSTLFVDKGGIVDVLSGFQNISWWPHGRWRHEFASFTGINLLILFHSHLLSELVVI